MSESVEPERVVENIEETTAGELLGTRVAMGSMLFDCGYELPDGSEARGMACNLALPNDISIWVGMGSTFVVDGITWRVTAIEKERGELGSVTLTAESSAPQRSLDAIPSPSQSE